MKEVLKYWQFDNRSTNKSLAPLEKKLIKKHKPHRNKTKGGELGAPVKKRKK